MSMFIQYAPYQLRGGSWDDQRDAFADRCFDLVNEYAPNFKSAVIDRQVLAPPDLERVFNLTGGNIFQGAMTPASSSRSVRCPATRATGRRSAASTCAARPPTPAEASWVPPALTPHARSWAGESYAEPFSTRGALSSASPNSGGRI